jgi:hypothetical protein
VLLGTDYPFVARQRPAGAGLDGAAVLPEDVRSAIGRANTTALLDALAADRGLPTGFAIAGGEGTR